MRHSEAWVSEQWEADTGAQPGGLTASEPCHWTVGSIRTASLLSVSVVLGTWTMLSPQVEFSGWAKGDH